MKIVSLLSVAAVLVLSSANATAAGSCGSGVITHIKEGGWNTNAFLIHIDDSVELPTGGSMYKSHWVKFNNTLDSDRFRGIKALAYMAFSSGKTVRAYTSGASCQVADDLTIFLDSSTLDPS